MPAIFLEKRVAATRLYLASLGRGNVPRLGLTSSLGMTNE
jgi:hypothetical protein